MKAAVVTAHGGPEVLEVQERPTPVPGPGEVRVRVQAATVQPVDTFVRAAPIPGLVRTPPPLVLGWDAAGVVDSLGEGVEGLREGDPVIGFSPWPQAHVGTHAEYVVLDRENVVRAPEGVDAVHASTIPLNGQTAVRSLETAALESGETFLVTGAAGAVGRFAVELTRGTGVRIVALARESDRESLLASGADVVVASIEEIQDPVDVVLDAALLSDAVLPAVRDGGRVVTTGPTARITPTRGITSTLVMVEPARSILEQLSQAAASGRITLPVEATFPLERTPDAHRRVEAGHVRGRVVVTI